MMGNQLKKLILLFFMIFAGAAVSLYLLSQKGAAENGAAPVPVPPRSVYRVGILQSDQVPEQDRMRAGLLKALASKGYEEGKKVSFEVVNGAGQTAALQKGAQSFRQKKDLVIVIGNDAAEAAAAAMTSTPVVGIGILNFKHASWLDGHENFTGMSSLPSILRQVGTAARVLPIKTVGVLFTAGDEESAMQLGWLRAAAERKNVRLYEVAVQPGEDPARRAAAFKGHADAVYIGEDEKLQKDFDNILQVLHGAKIPVIGADENMVRRGALLSVSEDYYRMGFSAGLMAARLLDGGIVPEEIPIARQGENDIVVNMASARTLHIELPVDIWQKARKLYLYDGQPARP